MFPMIMNCGQKMIERIDMQIGNRIKQTINTKDVSSEPFPHSSFFLENESLLEWGFVCVQCDKLFQLLTFWTNLHSSE